MAKAKGVKTKTSKYDVADHLRTPAEMAAYLDAWLTDAPDDAAGVARALGDIARAKGMTRVKGTGAKAACGSGVKWPLIVRSNYSDPF